MAAAVPVLLALTAPVALGQSDETPSTTSTTAPVSSSSVPSLFDTTTTTEPDAGTPTTEAPPADDGPASDPDGTGTEDGEGVDSSGGGRSVPAEAQAIINSVKRTAPNSSTDLYEGIQELVALGMTEEEAIRVGFGRFPVAGPANYSHDWLYPRYGPGFRFHLGTDVFAPFGTPLRAPVDGTVTSGTGSLGGLFVKVFMADGTYFYLAHLSALPAGFEDGMTVKTGDIVGYVGDSGNARGGASHLHIGVYPRGGGAVDPKPILDQMLADAEEALPGIIAQVRASGATPSGARSSLVRPTRTILATSMLRPVVGELAAGGAATAVLFETVGNPTAGGLAVVEAEAADVAEGIDWQARADRARAGQQLVLLTGDISRLAFGALTPFTVR